MLCSQIAFMMSVILLISFGGRFFIATFVTLSLPDALFLPIVLIILLASSYVAV